MADPSSPDHHPRPSCTGPTAASTVDNPPRWGQPPPRRGRGTRHGVLLRFRTGGGCRLLPWRHLMSTPPVTTLVRGAGRALRFCTGRPVLGEVPAVVLMVVTSAAPCVGPGSCPHSLLTKSPSPRPSQPSRGCSPPCGSQQLSRSCTGPCNGLACPQAVPSINASCSSCSRWPAVLLHLAGAGAAPEGAGPVHASCISRQRLRLQPPAGELRK